MKNKWSDLTLEQQRRLALPRAKLTKEEKALRKHLFWNDKWIDSAGNEQRFQAPKTEKEKEEKEKKKNASL